MVWPVVGAIAAEWIGSEMQGQHNAEEASKNRSFQQHMSGTAYSRAAHDLQSAGLNRVLAMGGPAATPSGATSSIEKPNFAQAGIAAASAKQQIDLQKAEESLTEQKESESKSAEALNQVAALTSATQGQLNTANATSAAAQARLLDEQAKKVQQEARKVKIEADRGDVLNPIYRAMGDFTDWLDKRFRSNAKDNDGWWPQLKKGANDFFHDDPDKGWFDEGAKKWQQSDRSRFQTFKKGN